MHLEAVFLVLYWSTVDYSSLCRIPLEANSSFFDPRLQQVLVPVSACVAIPYATAVITIRVFSLVRSVPTVHRQGSCWPTYF